MSQHQRLLEQLKRAEQNVLALPPGVRESHPIWKEIQERRRLDAEEQESSRKSSPTSRELTRR